MNVFKAWLDYRVDGRILPLCKKMNGKWFAMLEFMRKNDDNGRKSNFEGRLFKMIYQASQHSNHTILKDVR